MRARWLQRLRGGVLRDDEALALLSDYGVPVVPHGRASTEEEACRVAERLGWPVVLKTSAPGLTHKTEVSGVVTSIRDEAGLRAAYRELSARLGPDVLVAGEVQGVELALGTLVDPQFGPLVLVGAGGVLVELLRDRAVALAPTDERWAGELVDRLSIRRLLDGHRGAPPADTGSLCRAVAVLSVLAADLAPSIAAVDVNPFIVGPAGGVAVDALVVPGSHSPQRGRASGSG